MLKFLFYALLAYLLLRAVGNLLGAMAQERVGSGPAGGSGRNGRRDGRRNVEDREDARATRLRDEPDVEDARWEDL